jgi:hypothetical protein
VFQTKIFVYKPSFSKLDIHFVSGCKRLEGEREGSSYNKKWILLKSLIRFKQYVNKTEINSKGHNDQTRKNLKFHVRTN